MTNTKDTHKEVKHFTSPHFLFDDLSPDHMTDYSGPNPPGVRTQMPPACDEEGVGAAGGG